MKNKTKEKLKVFLERAKNFFTEVETVYVEDKEGDYTAVRTEEYNKLDEIIKSFVNDINNSLGELDENQSKEIKESINMLKQMDFSKVDSSAVGKILEEAQKEIEESKSIRIDRPAQIGKGGYMGVVYRTEDANKLGNPDRPTGGFMLPRDEELADEFGGDYTKSDRSIEIFKKALDKINEIEKETNSKTNEELRKKIIQTLKTNKQQIVDKVINGTINKPEGTKIKEVHRNKGLKRIVSILLAASLTVGAFSIGFSMKSENLSIPISANEQYEKMNVGENTDNIVYDIISNLSVLDSQNDATAKEAETIGKTKEELKQMGLDGLDLEVSQIGASREGTSYKKESERIEEEIRKIEEDYKNIKNPNNLDWIEYQSKLSEKNVLLLNLNKNILEKINKYAEAKIDFNEEHISIGLSNEAQERHELENDSSTKLINENENKISEIDNQIQEFSGKKEFLNKIKSVKQIEDIKDIDVVVETLYNFKNSDICKDMSLEEFVGIIDVVDANLFVSLINNKNEVNNLEQFLEEYEKVELGYKTYTEVYSGGDKSRVDKDKYVSFYVNALKVEKFQDIGKDSKIKGLNDISDINREYYDSYGKADTPKDMKTGFFHKLEERMKNVFKGTRGEEYNDMVKTIKTMQQEKDNTKDVGEFGDAEK